MKEYSIPTLSPRSPLQPGGPILPSLPWRKIIQMKKTATLQVSEGNIHLFPASSSCFLTSSTGHTCDQSENKQQEYSLSRSVAVCGEQTQTENEEALGGV